MPFSKMQKEYFKNASHRWNIKSGATRSGKTYMDYFVIPMRLRAVSGKDGLNVILGNTKTTLQRNIIEPLQSVWGISLVSDIRSNNTATLFGETVHCLGADKISQVDKIRGSSIKYCYGDEVVTWNEEVFNMLKSRLDKDYSKFDGTCNPNNPSHWFKTFLNNENKADIYLQEYTIDDNPFLAESVKENLKREYRGTIFYDRYILGRWVPAEGLIYRLLADNPKHYMIDEGSLPPLHSVCVGEDFGGNKSGHAIVCSGIGNDGRLYFTNAIFKEAKGTTTERVLNWSVKCFDEIYKERQYWLDIYPDNAEQMMINSLRERTHFNIYNSIKSPIIDRIRALNILIGDDRVRFVRGKTEELVKALCEAVWDNKSMEDKRLDNGTFNNDVIDAAEYSLERNLRELIS